MRWRLGLRPRPRWGAYDAPSDPLIVRGNVPSALGTLYFVSIFTSQFHFRAPLTEFLDPPLVCSVQLIFSIILYDRTSKACTHFVSSYSRSTSLIHAEPLYSTSLFLSTASSNSWLAFFSVILSSLRNGKCLFPIAVLLLISL